MRSLFWRIFFSLMALIVALVLVTFAIDATTRSGGPPSGFAFRHLQLHGPPHDVLPSSPPPGGFPPGDQVNNGLPQDDIGRPPSDNGPPPNDRNDRPPDGFPPPRDPGDGPGGHGPPHSPFDALRIYNIQGAQGVDRYFEQIKAQTGSEFYLFDQTGNLLAGGKPSQSLRNLTLRTIRSNHLEVDATSSAIMHADVLHSAGKTFVIADVTFPRQIDLAVAALRIVSVIVIAALVCWWLTRQITQPIVILRKGAQDLAAGRFQTRVKPLLNGRRDELGSLAQDFDTMAQRLDTLVTAQNRLLADVSHELRSPLARLSVATALARRAGDEEMGKTLDRVDREAERLNELIGQLTLVSRLEMDTATGISEDVDLADVLHQVCEDAQYEAKPNGKEVACRLEIALNEKVHIAGNNALIRSAIENIVRNAVRYTESKTKVEVTLKTEIRIKERWAIFEVRDHGHGVADYELDSIFKPFYRTAEARDRDSGGVGLGLAIAQRAAIRHGGAVTAQNAKDGGLIVTMELPAPINT